MPDPMFRQRLRQHYDDLQKQMALAERGSPAFFDIERAMSSTARLHTTLYGEAMRPIHSGPHPVKGEE